MRETNDDDSINIVSTTDIVKKSISCSKVSMMYINGTSIAIFGSVSEYDVQKRKGWIERRLRQSGNTSLENIMDCINLSRFWLNYVELGARYPNVVDDATYKEWDKDRVKPDFIDAPKSTKPRINTNTNDSNRQKHSHSHSYRNNPKSRNSRR